MAPHLAHAVRVEVELVLHEVLEVRVHREGLLHREARLTGADLSLGPF